MQQSGWTQTEPDPDVSPVCGAAAVGQASGGGYVVTLSAGATAAVGNFGNTQAGSAAGTKFEDGNANGTRDPGDPGLSGWEIRAYEDANGDGILQATEDTIADFDITDGSGAYTLSLPAGDYVICEVPKTGWTQSLPSNDKCAAISGMAAGGHAVTVASKSSSNGNE